MQQPARSGGRPLPGCIKLPTLRNYSGIRSWPSPSPSHVVGVEGTRGICLNLSQTPWDGFLDLAASGNSALLGVRAEATLRADLLTLSLTFHSRFLARKKRVAVVTTEEVSTLLTTAELLVIVCHTTNQAHDDDNDNDDDQTARRDAYGA